jgi:2-polyprenyl-6-methoxyphenol hydroxylase-like FAD-dependent oxidoreductase
MDILISGAGIAGPAMAWWLAEHGLAPTIVEEAPAPRSGGYVIDFWGKGYDIAEKMGLMPELLEAGYQVGEVRLVGDDGRRRGGFKTEVFDRATGGRFVSLPRGELSLALNRAVEGRAEMVFGDRITTQIDDGDAVNVTFKSGAERRFDLVIGAEGIHSETRKRVFGPHERFETYLDYKFAAYIVDGYAPRTEDAYIMHSEPGMQAARFALRDGSTLILLIWWEPASNAVPHGEIIQKALLRNTFGKMRWEVPAMLEALDGCRDLYMDTVSQVRMDRWAKGRTALIGDAAFAPSFLAGQGSALAIIGGYVLAGELGRAGGDYEAAFARYEALLQPFLAEKQKAATKFAGAFAPKTQLGITFRNWVTKAMGLPFVADMAMGQGLTDQVELPDY